MAKRTPIHSAVLIDVETVNEIHSRLTEEFAATDDPISPPGIRDTALLESAVHRQHTGFGTDRKYAHPLDSSAALIYSVCNNHAFHNGNKRTALVAGLVHLDRNGYVLDGVTKEDLFRLMRRIASHHFSRREVDGRKQPEPDEEIRRIADWLRNKARLVQRGDRSIKYSDLYKAIESFGYVLGAKRNNYVEVLERRKGWFGRDRLVCVTKVPCPGHSRLAPISEVKRARRELRLDEEHGVDSYSFYTSHTVIDEFINSHRGVLRRLARV